MRQPKGVRESGLEHVGAAAAQEAPADREVMLALARRGLDPSRVVGALVRRIVEIQDEVSEAELLALVHEVGALLRTGAVAH